MILSVAFIAFFIIWGLSLFPAVARVGPYGVVSAWICAGIIGIHDGLFAGIAR